MGAAGSGAGGSRRGETADQRGEGQGRLGTAAPGGAGVAVRGGWGRGWAGG